MDWKSVAEILWNGLNTPFGVTVAAGIILWSLNRIYALRPEWEKYEGTIISAIKYAEKVCPDNSPHKGLAKLDEALKYVISCYEEARGKKPSAKTVASLKEGIQVVHSELEATGVI